MRSTGISFLTNPNQMRNHLLLCKCPTFFLAQVLTECYLYVIDN